MNGPANISGYAEIGITTNFSFLRGGSDPRAYVQQAGELGIPVIGIADHNTLAGVVRAWKELDNPEITHKPKFLIGARIGSATQKREIGGDADLGIAGRCLNARNVPGAVHANSPCTNHLIDAGLPSVSASSLS